MTQSTRKYERRGFFEPFVFPFRQEGWFELMWWLPVIDFLPFVNVILLRGWRLEMVRRMARGEEQPLPDANLVRFFKNGLVLWAMTAVYAFVPIVIIISIGAGGFLDLIGDIRYIYDYLFTDKEVMPFVTFLKSEFLKTIVAMAIDSIWILISLPLYRAAMIRYAITGRFRSFGQIWANLLFVARNFGSFCHLYLFSLVSIFLVAFATTLLLSTTVGVLLVPILTLPLYYWSTATEYGFLAQRLCRELEQNGTGVPPPKA